MGALKTVKRAGDLKLLKRKFEILTREVADFTNKQNALNREIKQTEQKLSALKNTQRANNTFRTSGGQGALRETKTEKLNDLNKKRDSLSASRKNVLENRAIITDEIIKGEVVTYDKIESANKEIALVSAEIGELVKTGETDSEKYHELNETLDTLIENRETTAREIADIEYGYAVEIENIDKEIDTISLEIEDLIKDDVNREREIEILTQTHDSLIEKRDSLDVRISESTSRLNDVEKKIADVEKLGLKKSNIGKSLKTVSGAVKGAVANTAKSGIKNGLKSGFTKVDPFAKGISKEDVGDTGAESIRLARQIGSKTVSTVKSTNRTLKTSKRTLKTATKAVVNTAKATYRTTVNATKATIAVVKFVGKATAHFIAALSNPIVLIAAAVLLVTVIISQCVVILMGGAAGGKSITVAYGAVGLGDVPTQYEQGTELLDTAAQNARNGFNALVDAARYLGSTKLNPPGELAHSDLIFLRVRKANGTVTNYETAFAAPWQKGYLKGVAWDAHFPKNEILAIAYVLLQKNENTAKGTTGQIYMIEYSLPVFEQIIALMVEYNSTITHNRPCPERDCTTVMIPNPAYVELEGQIADLEQQIAAVQLLIDEMEAEIADLSERIADLDEKIAELDTLIEEKEQEISETTGPDVFDLYIQLSSLTTQKSMFTTQRNSLNSQRTTIQMGSGTLYGQRSSLNWTLNQRQNQLANTPPEIESEPFCDWLHDLHSIELRYFTTERVMNSLGFTTAEKQWVELTKAGFDTNPALS